ncbi:DNA repair protein (DNA repair protein) (fragment) [Bradyrhizobium sp. STM 3809]
MSSLVNAPLPPDAVYFGEISLSGAVRPVAQTSARLKEAAKLGFLRVVLPERARGEAGGDAGLNLNTVGGLTSLVADIAARGTPRARHNSAREEGDAAEPGRRAPSHAEKNATPARFRRQDG